MHRTLRQDLITTSVGHELLIYDPRNNKVHALNPPAAAAFHAAQDAAQPTTQLVLDLFAEKGFFEEAQPAPPRTTRTTRRETLAFLGKVAMAPLITTVALPTPAFAVSGSVTEAECRAGLGCGMMCSTTDPIGPKRRCGTFTPNGPCGCQPDVPQLLCPCSPSTPI